MSTFLYYRRKKWKNTTIATLIFIIASINPMAVNVTSVYTLSAAIFVLITFILDFDGTAKAERLIIFFLISAAGSTLKNSALIVTIMYSTLFLIQLLCALSSLKDFPKYALQSFKVVIVCLFPWCLSLYLSSGTLLYPIMGVGYHGSRYGNFNYSVNIFTSDFVRPFIGSVIKSPLYSPILMFSSIALVSIFKSRSKRIPKFNILLVGIVILLNYLAIAIGSANFGTFRYNFPFLLAFTIAILQYIEFSSPLRLLGIYGLSIMFSVLLIQQFGKEVHPIFEKVDPSNAHNRNGFTSQPQISRIQDVIPSGARVLLRTERNFMFDFKRNQFLIADYPGESSPPPGIPLFSNPDELKNYLLKVNIGYIVFQFKGLFEKEAFSDRLNPSSNPWLRVEAENAFAFEARVLELAASNPVLYQDSKVIVIRLEN
jgi:hypothetical protein